MAFTSYDDLIEKITVNEQSLTYDFFRGPFNAQGAGVWYLLNGGLGSPGDNLAGMFTVPSRSPASTNLLTFGAASTANGTLLLFDLLYISPAPIAITPVGSKVVNTTPLPRYATGNGVEAWMLLTTANASGGAVTVTSYTNQDGVAGRVGTFVNWPFTASFVSTLIGPMPLQAGDTGVRSVENITTGTSTAGALRVILMRPLARLPLSAFGWTERDLGIQIESFPTLFDGCTLSLAWQAASTSTTTVNGQIATGWG
jgi:hypothetical protein